MTQTRVAGRSVAGMTPPTWDALTTQCRTEGLTLYRRRLDGARGLWALDARTIWIDSRLSDAHAAPVLAHELTHAHRGDRGCQPGRVEEWIDERVALAWIDRRSYARAESIRGPYAAGIADELDLPRWVVEAFQRALSEDRGTGLRAS